MSTLTYKLIGSIPFVAHQSSIGDCTVYSVLLQCSGLLICVGQEKERYSLLFKTFCA